MLDTLGKRLKYAREQKGIKQNFAAKKLGISAPTLANYETDFRRPDPVMLQKMIELYEVDANFIIGSDTSSSDREDNQHSNDRGFQEGERDALMELRKMLENGEPITYKGKTLSTKQKKNLATYFDLILDDDNDDEK